MTNNQPRHQGKVRVSTDENGLIVLAVPEDNIRLEFDPDNAIKVAQYMAHGAYRAQGYYLEGVAILPLGTPPPAQDGRK